MCLERSNEHVHPIDYLDDIVIILRTPEEHIDLVPQLLTLLYDAGVTLNLKKWEFFKFH